MPTKLLRRHTRRPAALPALFVGMGLCLGVLAPATPVAAITAPIINSFTPTSGTSGTNVTINGANLSSARVTVKFNGVTAVVHSDSGTQISTTVPPMTAQAGPITVTTGVGATATSATNFTVIPAVVLSSSSGTPASSVKVSGTSFGASEGVDIYFDTTDLALGGTSATGGFGPVTISVPASAVPGVHWISAEGRHSGLFAQASFTVSTNWSQFRYSSNHRGRNPYENVLSRDNVSGIDQDWSFTTGGGVQSSPAVANGSVYVGSNDGNVYSLDASTGAQQWSFATGGPVLSAPTEVGAGGAQGAVVYVGSDDGNVYDLLPFNGSVQEQWAFATQGSVTSSPVVVNGVVYVGSGDGNVYALNGNAGTELWSFATGGNVRSSPAVAGGVVYVGSDSGNVYALSAATGAELWSFTTGNGVTSSPAVANGVVYVGSNDGKVYALNSSTGAELWSFTTVAPVESSPAVANGVVYIGSVDRNIYALKASTGTELWSVITGSGIQSSPAVANGVVYVGSNDGNVYAFDASTGAQLWSYTTGNSVVSSPAVANGVVYVGSLDQKVYAFDLAGGLAAPVRPGRGGLHPNYSLPMQR